MLPGLIEGWLGLVVHKTPEENLLQEALNRQPLVNLSRTNQAGLLTLYAQFLAQTGEEKLGCSILEKWLQTPMLEYARAERLEGVPLITRAGFVRSWLRAAGPFHAQAPEVCEAFLTDIVAVRAELNYKERRDLIHTDPGCWRRDSECSSNTG